MAYNHRVKEVHGVLEVDGIKLRTRIVRKRVRNINVRLVDDELRVSAPPEVPQRELDEVVLRLAGRLVRRARAATLNADEAALKVAKRIAARFPKAPRVSDVRFVTTQRSRWGSYSQGTGIIRLNAGLGELPRWVLEAVMAHELAHSFHANHSPKFWSLLRSVCPETDRARAFLAGVSWIARRWESLPPVERALFSAK
ncbi:MAG: M48 family metallopeptidase [bacterium]|nr:M48 family metallopeptidase [bacterium]